MLRTLQNLDGALLLAVQSLRQDWLDPLVVCYTHLGDAGAVWIALGLLLLCFRPTRKAGAAALLALVLGLVCTNLTLKPLVSRPRPWLSLAELVPLVAEHDPNSFPSGHTCAAFAACVAWFVTLPRKWGTVAVTAAVCMGLSRLYVGVHYPSDVLVGALVGSLCGLAACRLVNEYERRRTLRR